MTNIYQSAGACVKTCNTTTTYSYAILQDNSCWCSNTAPSSTVNITQCDTPCPGYPTDDCGSKTADLFTYVPINDTNAGVGVSQTAPYTGAVTWNGATATGAMATGVYANATGTYGSGNGSASATSSPITNSAGKGMGFSVGITGLVFGAAAALML